jgi:carnitine monooxygenase subunit
MSTATRAEPGTPQWARRRAAVAADMQSRLYTHLKAGTTDQSQGPQWAPAELYSNPDRFEAERQVLFRGMPLLAGLSVDLPAAGSKLLFDFAGPPIVVVRSRSDEARAFLNVCSHRGSRLVEQCHPGARMTCPFHGWTFNLDGQLIAMPGARSFTGIGRDELSLKEVPATEQDGLIFVLADPDGGDIDLASHLGPFAAELAQLELGGAQPIKHSRIDADANWKYCVDTFGESYHLATLHPNTVGRSAVNDTMVFEPFGLHHRIGYAPKRMAELAKLAPASRAPLPFSAVHLLFPNTIIHVTTVGPGHATLIYRVFPGTQVGRSFTTVSTYRGGDVPRQEPPSAWEELHDYQVNVVGSEDYRVAAAAQVNFEQAPATPRVVYGANELSIQRFETNVATLVESSLRCRSGPHLNEPGTNDAACTSLSTRQDRKGKARAL